MDSASAIAVLSALSSFLYFVTQGCANPGLKLANAVGVILKLRHYLISACGSMILSTSARLALSTIHTEMDFIWRQSKRATPAEIVEQHKPHFVHFRRHE